jgi:ubiquinone biosynthesis protein
LIENRVPEARQIGLVAVIEDFAKLLRRELDYDRESRNTERVRHSFAEDERIVIPQVYWDYTTPRVLTEEFIDGIKFSNISEIEARGWDRQKISSIATEAFLTQIMIHGFFNSDPHPGNMLIIDQERISFIDFGQVGQLTPKRLEKIGILLWRLGNKDLDGALAALQDMGIVGENIPVEDFQADLADLVEQVSTGNIGNINLEQLRKDIFDLAFRYHLQMPSYLTALMKALITVEGVGKKLDPTFDFIEVAKPIAKKMVREQIKPDNLWQTARRNYYSDLRPLISFPKNFNNLIKTTGEGKLNMQIQIGFNSEARTKMTQLVNRLSASLVIAGGLIGSAFILSSDVNPSLNHGNTVIGFIGFTVSLLGLLALLSFLRSK